VFITIDGKAPLFLASGRQDGDVLDIVVQNRRDKHVAKRFFRKLPTGPRYVPRGIVTGTVKFREKISSSHKRKGGKRGKNTPARRPKWDGVAVWDRRLSR
jgi:transposase-like protein